MTYGWDAASDRTAVTWPDTGSNALTASYGYDMLQRVTSIKANGAVVGSYAYDTLGRRSSVARNAGTGAPTAYGYDGADRIQTLTQSLTGTGAVTFTLGYDASGGLITRQVSNDAYTTHPGATNTAYAANGLNQYTAVGGAAPAYDARGDTTTEAATARTFSYDLENRLTGEIAPTSVTLAYDPTGTLMSKTAATATTSFLYAGDDLVGEYSSTGSILARYIPGPGIDEPLLWYSGSGTTTPQWLHADQQGSIIAWSNGAGASQGTQAYGPYGEPLAWSGSRYAYTGQIMIGEAQLYHYKARAYAPQIGRFLQTDPAGMASDVNLYAYVGNDPMDWVDPDGLEDTTVSEAVVTACSTGWTCSEFDPVSYYITSGPSVTVNGVTTVSEVVVFFQRKPRRKGCTASTHLNIDVDLGGTLFGGLLGVSAGVGVGVSIPQTAFAGDFRGTQIYLTGSGTVLAGLGLFAGAGPGLGYSASHSALRSGVSSSAVPVIAGGAGYGYGGEFQGQIGTLRGGLGDMSEGVGFSGGGGPRGAVGGYVGVGIKGAKTIATPTSWTGC